MIHGIIGFFHYVLAYRVVPDGQATYAWSFVGSTILYAVISYGLSLLFRQSYKATPEEQKPGQLQVQSSVRGTPVPVVYGKRRLSGNLLHYFDFQVHRHYETQTVGGKGGGGQEVTTETAPTYTVSFVFGICMGPATVLKIWRGKDEIPVADWAKLGIRFYSGTPDQPIDATLFNYLTGLGQRVPAYRNLCYIVYENFDLGQQTFLPNFSHEVASHSPGTYYQNLADLPQSAYVTGFWKLEEASGELLDETGNNSLQVASDVAYRAAGKVGYCGNWTTANTAAVTAADISYFIIVNQSFTLAAWINISTSGLTGIIMWVVDGGGINLMYSLSLDGGKAKFSLGAAGEIMGNTVLTTGWHLLVGVYTYIGSGTSKLDIYVDSVSDATQITNAGVLSFSYSTFGLGQADSGELGLIALYDEIAFWKGAALSQADIDDLYDLPQNYADDTTPPDIAKDILTNDLYGLGLATDKLDLAAFSNTKTYCEANDMLISILMDGFISAVDFLQNLLAHHNGYIAYQDGKISYRQIKSETISNPLTVGSDIVRQGPPVDTERGKFRNVRNKISVRYTKRADGYTTDLAVAPDEVHQQIHGILPETVSLLGYTSGDRAQKFGFTLLRRNLKVLEKHTFIAGPRNIEKLMPGAVFALSDSQLGLSNFPMRVLTTKESENYEIEVEAVEEIDYVMDVKTGPSSVPTTLPPRAGDPGSVVDLMLSEFPPLITLDALIVGVQYSQPAGKENWAGATIYQSYDDATYTAVQSSYGSGLTGTVDLVTEETIRVTVTDEDVALQSVADVFALLQSLNTNMCWAKETDIYFRFATATLVAPGQWDLSGIIWDCYRAPTLLHKAAAGQTISFMREKRQPVPLTYPLERKGKTIYVKVVSFNFYGEHEDISLLTPVSIGFEALGAAPIVPKNLEVSGCGSITTIPAGDIVLAWRSCNRSTQGLDYSDSDQIQEDSDFVRFDIVVKSGAATLRHATSTTPAWTYTAADQATDGSPTAITFEVTKVSNFNKSQAASLGISIV